MYGRLQLGAHLDHAAFARAQCGLCAHYGARYRLRTRLLAGRDPSMLVLLAEALTPSPLSPDALTRVRCPLRLGLTRRSALRPDWAPLEVIAALQVVLAAEKLRDDVRDRDGTLARVAARLLLHDVATAERVLAAHAFPLAPLRVALAAQSTLEASRHADLDGLSAPTGEALALATAWLAHALALEAPAPESLAVYGRRLGRTLYMVDALEDFVPDRARAAFNPLTAALGALTPARRAYLAASFAGLTRALAAAYDALPLHRHHAALRDATVDALAARGQRALVALVEAA